MPRPNRAGGTLPLVPLDRTAPEPLYIQLYKGLRDRIRARELAPGIRLASTRAFAADLGVSRFTVLAAFERLLGEGYIVAREGGGTYVAAEPPALVRQRKPVPRRSLNTAGPVLSVRGQVIASVAITGPRGAANEPRPFRPNRPPLDAFPFALWTRLLRRQWSEFHHSVLDYGDPAGYGPLREAIAAQLMAARGVQCRAEQVIVTSGAQQAYDLLFRLLLDTGDKAWIEEPGYLDVRGALAASNVIVPVPVDAEGLDVDAGRRLAPDARLVYVSPSHQYPTGATLSAARRAALLEWADAAGAWIVEDDYDSHFRYQGSPLQALQSLDASWSGGSARRVVYVGSFSKSMFPALRLGYCVVPDALIDPIINARAIADRHSPLADQAALAAFINDGHYDAWLRRMRSICAERREALEDAIRTRLGAALTLAGATAGTHLLGHLPTGAVPGDTALAVARRAQAAGLVVFPLNRYCLTLPTSDTLVLGYGGLNPAKIQTGVEQLARVIETL